jgi:hypothetical protein
MSALGAIYKEGSYYYHYRVLCINSTTLEPYGLMNDYPYTGEVWRATSLSGPWTFMEIIPNFANTWAHQSLMGSVYKVGAIYYFMVMGYNSSTTTANGIFTASAPTGPFTNDGSVLTEAMLNAIYGGSNGTENPRMFYHPLLQKYICISNTYKSTNLQQNIIQISSLITGFGTAFIRTLQTEDVLESTNQIGVSSPVFDSGQEVVIGANNFIPLMYDNSGLTYTPLWHQNRKVSTVMLEPSRNALRFDGSGSGKIYKTQSNTNFVVEVGVELPDLVAGDKMGFIYRSDGSGNNEYILQVRVGGYLQLVKRVSGVETTVQTGSGGQIPVLRLINRVKIVVNGTSHKAYLNGQLQVDVTNSQFVSGTHIGFIGENTNDGDIRLLSIRATDIVTCTGLPEGTEVDLRADGGIVATSGLADSSGNMTFTLVHWPMESFYVNGKSYIVNGGIWGGDTFDFSRITLPSCIANAIVSATVENAQPTNVVVTFTESLNEGVIPDISVFVLSGKIVSSVSINGSAVTITVSSAYVFGDSISLDYTRPETDQLRSDPDTTYIASFTGQAVTNNVAYVPPAYSDEAIAYFARMDSQPDSTRKGLIDTLIVAGKTNGWWAKGDVIRLCASHTEATALLNMKGDYWNGTKQSTPTFTTDKGWAGSSTKYIHSNFNPNDGGCGFVQDNAMCMCYLNVNVSSTSNVLLRAANTIGGAWIAPNPASYIYGNINSVNGTNRSSGVAHGTGFVWSRRLVSTGMASGRNTSGGSPVYTSGPMYNIEFVDAYGTGSQQATVYYGQALSDAELALFQSDMLTYLTAIGAN